MDPRQQETLSADQNINSGNETERPWCKKCDGTGWSPSTTKPGYVQQCECRREVILKARIRTILDDWKEYKDATLETFKPRTIQQERALRMMTASPGSSFFIKGIYSQGKTRLLVCQYRRLAEQGVRCEIRTARDLVKELQLAEAPAEVGKTAFESPILKLVNLSPSGHLFIDDIEKAGVRSGFRAESLFHLFDTIKRRQIGLTVTTNLPMQAAKKGEKDLKTEMTDQVVSRLDQICSDIIDLG